MDFGQDLVRGSIVPIVLALLQERACYGYEIAKLVNARSGGRLEWKEGTLYPALHKLEADGLLRSYWADADAEDAAKDPDQESSRGKKGFAARKKVADSGGRQRKYYAITGKGRSELARRCAEWQEFSAAVNSVLLGGRP